MSKSKHKKKYKMFWTAHWRYNRTPEEWVNEIYDQPFSNPAYYSFQRSLLLDALEKLVLEKKILPAQCVNMVNMIQSPDKENALVAITIMAALKPKKFKKQVKTKNYGKN